MTQALALFGFLVISVALTRRSNMATGQVETLLALLEEAFESDEEHSLLGNMRNVDDAAWDALPPGGARPISELFIHAANGSWAYDDAAFRGTLGNWDARADSAPSEDRDPLVGSTRPAGAMGTAYPCSLERGDFPGMQNSA